MKETITTFEILSFAEHELKMRNAIRYLDETLKKLDLHGEDLRKFASALSDIESYGLNVIEAGRKQAEQNLIIGRYRDWDD